MIWLLILQGKYAAASKKLNKAIEAKDKLVAKRGGQMMQVLAHHPTGRVQPGKMLNDPKVLLEAFLTLNKQ